MSVHFQCECGHAYKVDAKFAGRQVKCKECGRTMTVPAADAAPAARAARPARPAAPTAAPAAAAAAPAARPPAKKHAAPKRHGRYAAITDPRHGKDKNTVFVVGGVISVALVGVVIAIAIAIATPTPHPSSTADSDANAAPTTAAANTPAPASPPTPAADGSSKPAADKPDAPPEPIVPAPDVRPVEISYDTLETGPFKLEVDTFDVFDEFTVPAPMVTSALGGEPLVVKPSRPELKIAVVTLEITGRREYTAPERDRIHQLPLFAQGERKLEDDEWAVHKSHLALAWVDPATGARTAVEPLILYPEEAEAGFIVMGTPENKAKDFAATSDLPMHITAAFEFNPEDGHPLLIIKLAPGREHTPAYVVALTNSLTKGSAGHTDLVKLDPALAPGERKPGLTVGRDAIDEPATPEPPDDTDTPDADDDATE